MKGKKVKVLMAGLALVAMSGLAIAAGPGYGFGGPGNCPQGYGQLNLTPEQQTKLNELQEKHWKDTVTLRNEMQTKRLELQTLWSSPNPDKDKILAKQKELNDLRNKMQAKGTDFRLEARKVLTPEQAAQVGTFGPGRGWGNHRMFRGGWGGPCQGAGAGPCQGAGYGPGAGGFGPGQGYGPGKGFGPGGARF
jgi:Spy/CpxP family protein refolding chaperone